MELSMASLYTDLEPSISLQQGNQLLDFDGRESTPPSLRCLTPHVTGAQPASAKRRWRRVRVDVQVRPYMNPKLAPAAMGHQSDALLNTASAPKSGCSDRAAAPGTMLRLCRTVQDTGAASRRVNDGEGGAEETLTPGGTKVLHVASSRMREA